MNKGTILLYKPYGVIKNTLWSPILGKDNKPENYNHVTYELSKEDEKTKLTLAQGNSPWRQDANSMIEKGWRPIIQEMKKLTKSS